jgi:transcriptional regulator with XRE-family HTH domain
MATELEKWAHESDENRRLFAQEGLILSVTEELWAAMERRGINQQQLANLIGSGKSYVSQLLNGSRNMTLRTFSDLAEALDQYVELRLCNREEQLWRTESREVFSRVHFNMTSGVAANLDSWSDAGELRA